MKNKFLVSKNFSNNDWNFVLDNSSDSNFSNTRDYYEFVTSFGYNPIVFCVYENNSPVAIINGFSFKGRFGIPFRLKLGDRFGPAVVIINSKKDDNSLKVFCKNFMLDIFKKNFFLYKFAYLPSEFAVESKFYCNVHIDLSKPHSIIMKNFKKSCRNAIAHSKRQCVNIISSSSENAVRELLSNSYFCKTDYNDLFENKFFYELFRKFAKKGGAEIWIAYKDDYVLSLAIIAKYKDKLSLCFLRSNSLGKKLKANNLLISEIAKKYACSNFSKFMIGGLGFDLHDELTGYGMFKKSFNPIIQKAPLIKSISKLEFLVRYYNFFFKKNFNKGLFFDSK
ncbi:MAG: hypothetical protein KJ583_04805 [Nanoarchaeota archaeon]|nr:hypothetical protein [Nanoarchaeota archaeon]MBU1269454.1 hypothetical protein [Nanoarchaeota archaeon]MBU1604611.1 hypothetical protein [Nanoarchaeota archaeon]MBU2442761.1 hypothetical protein [Nanoarchaeota archaeon]